MERWRQLSAGSVKLLVFYCETSRMNLILANRNLIVKLIRTFSHLVNSHSCPFVYIVGSQTIPTQGVKLAQHIIICNVVFTSHTPWVTGHLVILQSRPLTATYYSYVVNYSLRTGTGRLCMILRYAPCFSTSRLTNIPTVHVRTELVWG
jgi:hypothetical protein